MKSHKKLILIPITVLLGASLILGGCTSTAYKKPLQKSTPTPTKTKVTTPAPTSNKQMANRVVTEAEKEKGVRKATAVISGKMIYIGLDLDASLGKAKSAEVERKVLDRVKKMEPTYKVGVASDVDTVTRIKNVSKGIAQGKPLSTFTKELNNIGTRLKPRMK